MVTISIRKVRLIPGRHPAGGLWFPRHPEKKVDVAEGLSGLIISSHAAASIRETTIHHELDKLFVNHSLTGRVPVYNHLNGLVIID
jgi:hypothetical protein